MKVSLEMPEVISQQIQVFTSDPKATQENQGTSTTPASSATPTSPGSQSISSTPVTPATQTSQGEKNALLNGITMRWGLKNIPFPITRSCLAGTSL